jgi:hypothetical protein
VGIWGASAKPDFLTSISIVRGRYPAALKLTYNNDFKKNISRFSTRHAEPTHSVMETNTAKQSQLSTSSSVCMTEAADSAETGTQDVPNLTVGVRELSRHPSPRV